MIIDLPKDIILKIYDYLYLIDRLRLSECSKYMNKIFKEHKNDQIYEIKKQEDLKKILKTFKNMKFHFDYNRISFYDEELIFTEELNNLYSLKTNNINSNMINNIKILDYINSYGHSLDLNKFIKLKKLTLSTTFVTNNIFNNLKKSKLWGTISTL